MSIPRTPATPRNLLKQTIGNPGSTPTAGKRTHSQSLPPSATGTEGRSLEQLREAMRKHNPSHFAESPIEAVDSPSPSKPTQDLRRKVMRKPSTVGLGHSLSRPTTPTFRAASSSGLRSQTPTLPARSHTPTNPFNSSTSSRFTGGYPNYIAKGELEIGDGVSLDVLGERMEGIVRFLGQVDGKAGHFGGVELSGEWIGKGKNDGSVAGNQYFACPPLSGLFVPLAKLTPLAKASAYSPPAARPSSRSQSRTSFTKSPAKLALSQSTSTPRPRARVSIGGSTSTPVSTRTPRKSLGPAATRPVFGGGTPRVPPLPGRSATPTFGLGTPRRVSTSSSLGGPRSVSRSSFASSITRSVEGDEDDRESDMRKLLEGSERIGREMEVKLGDKEANLKEIELKLLKLEEEKIEFEVKEFAIREELQQAKNLTTQTQEKLMIATNDLVEAEQKVQRAKQAAEQDKLVLTTSIKALEEKVRQGIEREADFEEERVRLEIEVEELQRAGFDLCALHNVELSISKQETLDLSESLLRLQSENASESSSTSASNLRSSTTTLAEQIDQETILAETHHLRKKIISLEEALSGARASLESEMVDAGDRRRKALESEKESRAEIKRLKLLVGEAKHQGERMSEKMDELENALIESQTTLENERLEIELLRCNPVALPSSSNLLSESASKRERNDLLSRAAETDKLVVTLRQDLRAAEMEISKLYKARETEVAGEEIVGLRIILGQVEAEGRTEKDKLLAQLNESMISQKGLEATVANLMIEMTNSVDTSPKRAESKSNGSKELNQLQSELQSAKLEIVSLVKEVADLENLLEIKIFRETELEEEIASNKRKLSKMSSTLSSDSRKSVDAIEDDACEMCGTSGHELVDCPDFGGAPLSKPSVTNSSAKVLLDENFCDDCQEFGHSLEKCTLASEMF